MSKDGRTHMARQSPCLRRLFNVSELAAECAHPKKTNRLWDGDGTATGPRNDSRRFSFKAEVKEILYVELVNHAEADFDWHSITRSESDFVAILQQSARFLRLLKKRKCEKTAFLSNMTRMLDQDRPVQGNSADSMLLPPATSPGPKSAPPSDSEGITTSQILKCVLELSDKAAGFVHPRKTDHNGILGDMVGGPRADSQRFTFKAAVKELLLQEVIACMDLEGRTRRFTSCDLLRMLQRDKEFMDLLKARHCDADIFFLAMLDSNSEEPLLLLDPSLSASDPLDSPCSVQPTSMQERIDSDLSYWDSQLSYWDLFSSIQGSANQRDGYYENLNFTWEYGTLNASQLEDIEDLEPMDTT